MVDGNKDDLHLRRAKIQRLRASLKLRTTTRSATSSAGAARTSAASAACPASRTTAALTRVDPDAQAVACVDIDGDGKPDLCLVGAGKMAPAAERRRVAQRDEPAGLSPAAAAPRSGPTTTATASPTCCWPRASGPQLYTNLGKGSFRDDSHLLPQEAGYNLTAAAWIDYDGDGRPDILLGNGFHGLRLYRNKGKAEPLPAAPSPANRAAPRPTAGSRTCPARSASARTASAATSRATR